MQIGSSAVAEIIGDSGYDWVSVDLEHGSMILRIFRIYFEQLNLVELCHWLEFLSLLLGTVKSSRCWGRRCNSSYDRK